ncbi:2-oxoglutarate dehydrogenase complex dihydrolipoyllysine-residue succinyltransferase [Ectothiorhodospira lacustris]|uniref:2-oxoglutarate dehydrogenase complex dihydrolipoyllysine-residue succinyltransferase n=1 Tax=Ectothiorhodospira lacustris TaxID=2899127 RepID=UPI001EE94C6E|nr:2-oxoglutarate dehydrogenase complex dihydrolipoyllysine-residue succinyltransferase [Ectothiorhodospira lacustris]MCG5499781.1 2-oxoglutarate dehydrogenase complex dihydrolipoyllysine-residue succinyltransferase [Ectothiorhodospira lacustris]MCG5509761.1 2-oxoglutarate dehydrogenase complex dihydrolipoyllysine-residue succinyltransferase [Ectothiorhodospira lacustris]MCG5522325.1 2-oxoglutarate dehydrogenase complex dihydrolipoyllysine-residue succinyltransferase [Ectothiorhodospira lacustri
MSTEVKIPQLPESVSDATIVTWHKQPGDEVKRDEILVDIETDKVVLEVPAPQDGVMGEIIEQEGAIVTAGQVIAHLEKAGKGGKAGGKKKAGKDDDGKDAGKAAKKPDTATAGRDAADDGDDPALSPAVRRLVNEHSLDPAEIEGTGKGGRLLKEDVLKYLETLEAEAAQAPASAAPAPATKAAPAPASAPPPAPSTGPSGARPEKRVPMTRLRARIAERLVEAQQNAAMLTTFNEVNMKPVMDLRAQYKDRFEKRHGVRLGFMSFFVKAATEALKRFPEVNASIDGKDIVYHGYFDIGIAVSAPRGLVVPILRDTDTLTMSDVERTINDFGKKAEAGSLGMEDLTGGTFTISNGGVFGSLLSTPIINPPQSAILGMHRIQERPMAENGQVVIRPMMYLALSYDHRIVDGREAVQFLVTIKDMLEDPARLLLEV